MSSPSGDAPAALDPRRSAAFEERLVGALNEGALCLMASIGHRTGLSDVMSTLPAPAGSAAIAEADGTSVTCASGSRP